MGWDRSLTDWTEASLLIQRVYQEELGRVCDFGGAVNWLAHWREGEHGAEFESWVRRQFRDSPEGRLRHGERGPDVPDPGAPPPDTPELPPASTVRVFQVTDASDGAFLPRMYSYWPNAWVSRGRAYVFAGHVDERPRFFAVDLQTGTVERLGPMVPYRGTSEGWYWDAEGWIYLLDGPRLRRVYPFGTADVVVLSIEETHPGCMLWQAHSSDDGQTHSASVKRIVNDGPYPAIGTVVLRHGRQEYFPAHGDLDESQITPDGRWLVIKEEDNNRVIHLETRDTQIIRDADGAVGHSDCGPALLVGEDNIHGACVRWDLDQPLTPGRRVELFSTWNMGHVSIRGGRCLLSTDTMLALVALDGSGVTPLLNHDMPAVDYDHQFKANLDPSGRVACYMLDSGRWDVYLAVLPGP